MKNKNREEVRQYRARMRGLLLMVLIVVNCYLLLSLFLGDMGVIKLVKMRTVHQQLQEEMASLRQGSEQLTREVDALKSDPHAIERLAREKLGLVKEGELVYEFYEK